MIVKCAWCPAMFVVSRAQFEMLLRHPAVPLICEACAWRQEEARNVVDEDE